MDELKKKQVDFLEAYKKNAGNVTAAAAIAGISRDTHYEWLKSDESDIYKKAFEQAQETLFDWVESKLMQQINDGNVTCILFFCKTKMKSRGYVETINQNHSGATDTNITIRREIID